MSFSCNYSGKFVSANRGNYKIGEGVQQFTCVLLVSNCLSLKFLLYLIGNNYNFEYYVLCLFIT